MFNELKTTHVSILFQGKLFDAIVLGENGSDCDEHIKIESENCRIYDWQKSPPENHVIDEIMHDELWNKNI